ncbi:inositol-pentakisphosphate 2-kinase-domain-containing protein [Trichoderma asperelloides]|nr:inositol-pentakisphosphate 2-kinase-domain-containing protein [Trichoderma asperelloides]
MDPAFLQLPPQFVLDDSASNYGSSVAGDCFDDDFLSDAGRDSPTNADSLAEDSEDEAAPGISSDDMVRLRAMSLYSSRDHKCDCDRDGDGGDRVRIRSQDASTRDRSRDTAPVLDMSNSNSDSVCDPLVSVSLLPQGTKPVRLVGEGAANVVFEIKLPPNSGMDTQFQGTLPFFLLSFFPSKGARHTQIKGSGKRPKRSLTLRCGYTDPVANRYSVPIGKLLRVAKAQALGRTPVSSNYYLRQQEFFIREIQPHLGDHAVRQELVVLHKSNIVDELNAMLRDVNHLRKPKFQGSFIGRASWGFLVEDMRPNGADGSMLIEFKPKWLLQSPSAPKNAIRCRQCALELRNYLKAPGTKAPCPEKKPCPIMLANPDCPQQVASPFRIAPQLSGLHNNERIQAALDKIIHHKAIQALRNCQKSLDHAGPLKPIPNLDFVVAMTLRDCTCFALIPPNDDGEIKLRFGDFDWKDPERKSSHWRGTEKDLIDGGFYTADWVVCDDTYYHPPSLCSLEWSGKPRTGEPVILLMEENTIKHDTNSNCQNNGPFSTTGTKTTTYRHKTDLAALRKGLEPFKRLTGGAPSDSIYNNPLRCNP